MSVSNSFPAYRLQVAMTILMAVLAAACAKAPPPPPPDPAFAALELRRIVVEPVAYATSQPSEPCSLYIDEELRSALVRDLTHRGYQVQAVGESVPRTFANGTPAPPAGDPGPAGLRLSPSEAGRLLVWIDEYWENTLCGWEGPKYLTMGAVGVLYAGSPPREVWRGQARTAEQGGYVANELIWLTTSRLTDQLLETLPAGPGWGQAP